MKIPKFLVTKKPPKKTFRASTARRSMAAPDDMDYEEMSEPNMKLSRALLIVLVLHVVAVAGIIAFNTIKSRQGMLPAASSTANTQTKDASVASSPPAEAAPSATAASPVIIAKIPAGDARRAEPVKTAQPVANTDASGNFYVVAKGDNPVKIAKKLKVSESELLAANHIDDPRKLQIGQKLIVPVKAAAKAKKSNE